ncbi:MAG: GNAT family N-acetyltransferase [Pikeienuella sp.]
MTAQLELLAAHPLSEEALAMIGQSEAELSALYRPEHRNAFSPQELVEADTRFIVAYDSGGPIGCGGMAPALGYGELKRIFVTRAARGRGVAKAIVARLEAMARALDLPLMRLETGLASPEAIALYTRLGYRERGPFGAYVENGSSVFMEKAL